MKDKSEAGLAPALGKGLEVLELLARTSSALSLSQIARALGRSVSELQRIVRVLESLGYLARNRQDGYLLTTRLFQLARHYSPYRWLTEVAKPEMETMADVSGESVHLAVLLDFRMLIVEQASGHELANVLLDVGSSHSSWETVSGRILLSGLGDTELAPQIDQWRLAPAKKKLLRRDLAFVRRHGWHAAPSNRYRGLTDVGVVVRDSRDVVCAALTTSWMQTLDGRKSLPVILKHLHQAASRIKRKLSLPR